ncbi:hypothetical protein HK104_008674 [Borealophlyctis nickersoniae]|nr:hypothetical protein HK104_008674 [Borealophlyctis nickersoniae]
MAAAGVDVLSIFEQKHKCFDIQLRNLGSFKFLVEELGYGPTGGVLSFCKSAISRVIARDEVKTLEWLMQNRVDLRANEMLERRLETGCRTQAGIFRTVEFLLRQGADPLFTRNDTTLLELAVEEGFWEVAGMMLTKLDPSAVVDYHLLKYIATEEVLVPRLLPPGDPNAFNGAALRVAASRNEPDIVCALLNRGGVPTESMLRAAIQDPEHILILLLLLPSARNYNISSLLEDACLARNIHAGRVLLERAEMAVGGSVRSPYGADSVAVIDGGGDVWIVSSGNG